MTDSSTTALINIIPDESPSIENFDPSDIVFEYGELLTQRKGIRHLNSKFHSNKDIINKLIIHPACMFSSKNCKKNFELKQVFVIAQKIIFYTYLQYNVFLMGSSPALFSQLIDKVLLLLDELMIAENINFNEPRKNDVSTQLLFAISENLIIVQQFNENLKKEENLKNFNKKVEKIVISTYGANSMLEYKRSQVIHFKINQLILQYFSIIITLHAQSEFAKEFFTDIVRGYLGVLNTENDNSPYLLIDYLNQLLDNNKIVMRYAALKQQLLNLSVIANGAENSKTLKVSNNDELDVSQIHYQSISKIPEMLQPRVCSLDKYMKQIFMHHTSPNNKTLQAFGSFNPNCYKNSNDSTDGKVLSIQVGKETMKERQQ